MEREEVRQLLTLLKTNYPQSFNMHTKESGTLLLDIWEEGLKDLPANIVLKAVKTMMLNDNREFAPNIGQVRSAIFDLYGKKSEEEALEAWQEVKSFMRGMNWDSSDQERYKKLPENIRHVYSFYEINEMAQRKASDNDTYEKPRFMKMFKDMAEARNQKLLAAGKLPEMISAGPSANTKKIGHSEGDGNEQ